MEGAGIRRVLRGPDVDLFVALDSAPGEETEAEAPVGWLHRDGLLQPARTSRSRSRALGRRRQAEGARRRNRRLRENARSTRWHVRGKKPRQTDDPIMRVLDSHPKRARENDSGSYELTENPRPA